MGRPREHDERDVRERVMRCFWELGFDAASIAALEKSAGINRRQLFRDYGNKRGLLLQALDDFTTFAGTLYLAPMERAGSGLDTIRDTLRTLAELPSAPYGHLGCLVCNTSRESLAQSDTEVAEKVRAFFRRIEAAYLCALTQAAARGEMDSSPRKLRAAARHMFAVHVSLLVLARSGLDQSVLADVAEHALMSLRSL
ncbi:MAG: TetR/AcrR family transcriptional regulator [Myxococcota bacterium]